MVAGESGPLRRLASPAPARKTAGRETAAGEAAGRESAGRKTVGLLRTVGRETVGLLGVMAVARGGSAPAGARQATAPGGIIRRAGHVRRGAGRIATVHRNAPFAALGLCPEPLTGPGQGQLMSG